MCFKHLSKSFPIAFGWLRNINSSLLIILAGFLGIITGLTHVSYFVTIARGISTLFVNLLSLISLPLIFLSIVSTISGMKSLTEMKTLGKKVIKYTILTTFIAATTALIIYLLVNPVGLENIGSSNIGQTGTLGSYLQFMSDIVPSNIVKLFASNYNVAGVVFFAILLSIAILNLQENHKNTLNTLFSSLFAAILQIAGFILKILPFAIWAFATLFVVELNEHAYNLRGLVLYLLVILSANIIQALIVLPTLLKIKGCNPIKIFKGMYKALTVAFFSRSSGTALPITMECAKENLKISDRVSSFSFPLCSTINMNACAAFILVTILFVSASNGLVFSLPQMIVWVFIATIAAIGNSSVPMGCYFVSSAFLASMNVPLYILGAILPFYTLLDMLETAVNVWSDACVATIVDKELAKETQKP